MVSGPLFDIDLILLYHAVMCRNNIKFLQNNVGELCSGVASGRVLDLVTKICGCQVSFDMTQYYLQNT